MLPWQHFCQRVLGQKFQFFIKKWHFSPSKRIYIGFFLARIRNQRLRIDPCAKFQLHWTKDKETRILKRYQKWLDDFRLTPSDDVSKILWLLSDFVLEYHHAKFGCNWTTNKGETEKQRAPSLYGYKRPQPE